MNRKVLSVLGLSILLFGGCLRENLAEPQASLTADSAAIVASAEFLPDLSDSTRVLRIRSNRSWFAHLNDEDSPVDPSKAEAVEWGYLDVCDHSNLTSVTDEVDVKITFRRNRSRRQIHGLLNFYTEGTLFLSVPILQEGAIYRLNASAERYEATCDPDRIVLSVDCNTDWTAKIGASTTADVSIDRPGGTDAGTITVAFGENFDASAVKTAEIILSAKGCPDKVVTFTQAKAVPYINILDKTELKIRPGQTKATLYFRSNCAWSAEVLGGELQDVVLSRSSGPFESGEQSIDFTFKNPGDDPVQILGTRIRITAPLTDAAAEANFSQRPVLKLDFNTYPNAPYGMETTYPEGFKQIDIPTSSHTYMCRFKNCRWRDYSASQGLQIKQDGEFDLPAINGLVLKEVKADFNFHNSFSKLHLRIIEAGNTTDWYSGLLNYYVISEAWSHVFELGKKTEPETQPGNVSSFKKPQAGRAYALYCSVNTNNLIARMELIYDTEE